MDNVQKGALIALEAVGVVVSEFVISTFSIEQARVEAEQQIEQEHMDLRTDLNQTSSWR